MLRGGWAGSLQARAARSAAAASARSGDATSVLPVLNTQPEPGNVVCLSFPPHRGSCAHTAPALRAAPGLSPGLPLPPKVPNGILKEENSNTRSRFCLRAKDRSHSQGPNPPAPGFSMCPACSSQARQPPFPPQAALALAVQRCLTNESSSYMLGLAKQIKLHLKIKQKIPALKPAF